MIFLKKGLAFLTFCLGTYFVLFLILFAINIGETPMIYRTSDAYYWFGGDTHERFKEFNKEEQNDVVILGSSHAYRGYDIRIFNEYGLKAYNLGSSGQSIYNTEIIAKNYLNGKNCKVVILDLYPGTLTTDGFESSSDLVANVSSDKAAFEIAKGLKDIRIINMMFLRFLTHSFSNPFFKVENYVEGGYVFKRDSVTKDFDFDAYLATYKSNPKNIRALEKLLQYLNQQSIKCIVVNHPMPKEISKEKFNEFNNDLMKVVKLTGHEFKNFAYDHDYHSKYHFYDHHHLNQAGVSKYNKQLISHLRENSYLN